MFTGIVETIGTIKQIVDQSDCRHFTITPENPFDDLKIGDSIAVNGICLTVTTFNAQSFQITAVPETLRLTNLNELSIGSFVNLECAMTPLTRMGGHYVQGHVDGISRILEISKDGDAALLVKISLSPQLAKYLINKGFVAIDGMSITVIEVTEQWFTVTFIPHTIQNSIVKNYVVGQAVNIEVDMLAKYVEKLIGKYNE